MEEISEFNLPGAISSRLDPCSQQTARVASSMASPGLQISLSQAGLWRRLQDDIAQRKTPECFVKGISDDSIESLGISAKYAAFTG